jgi:hypothetical protein
LAATANTECCFSSDSLSQCGQDGVRDARTSVSNRW